MKHVFEFDLDIHHKSWMVHFLWDQVDVLVLDIRDVVQLSSLMVKFISKIIGQ